MPRACVPIPWKWDLHTCHSLFIHHASMGRLSSTYQTVQPYAERGTRDRVGLEFRAGSSSSISVLRSLCSVVFSFNVLFGKLKHPYKQRERVINSHVLITQFQIYQFLSKFISCVPLPMLNWDFVSLECIPVDSRYHRISVKKCSGMCVFLFTSFTC